jgi:hypothetical protein
MTSPARPGFSDAAPGPAAPSGPPYPVIGLPSTTAAGVRAVADLIERSGITGLSVGCADGRIGIQVTAGTGTQARPAAAPANPRRRRQARS